MSAFVGLKTDSWDLTKGKIEIVDSWPMMASPGPMVIILAIYLLFVLRVGPSYMEKRSPYQLKTALLVYNAVQVVFSVFIAAKCLLHNLRYGIIHSKCLMNEQESQREVADCIWWYFVAKVTELLDTVFFVLRKKDSQVSFLHIYHHSLMMACTWIVLKYGPSDHTIFPGLLNSTVHIIMYSYYGLSALGPRFNKYLWWKKYLTRIQLVQFVTIAIILNVQGRVSECPLPRAVYWWFMFTVFMFFYLFADFYRKAFFGRQRKAEKKPITASVSFSDSNSNETVTKKGLGVITIRENTAITNNNKKER